MISIGCCFFAISYTTYRRKHLSTYLFGMLVVVIPHQTLTEGLSSKKVDICWTLGKKKRISKFPSSTAASSSSTVQAFPLIFRRMACERNRVHILCPCRSFANIRIICDSEAQHYRFIPNLIVRGLLRRVRPRLILYTTPNLVGGQSDHDVKPLEFDSTTN